MREMWRPTVENLDDAASGVDPDALYNRNEACAATGMAGSVFDRYVRQNSLFIAYGETIVSGRFKFYPGREIIKQFDRLKDGRVALELFSLYYGATDEEFAERVGKPKSEVFAEQTYLLLGGWKGRDW